MRTELEKGQETLGETKKHADDAAAFSAMHKKENEKEKEKH